MRRKPDRLLLLALLGPLLLAPFLAGCPCTLEDADRRFHEDWEECAGLCGWEVLAGEARVVETYHSAEHALQFVGAPVTVRRSVDVGSGACAGPDCPLEIGLVTDCWGPAASGGAEGPLLGARVAYRSPAGTEVRVDLVLSCSTAGGTLYFCAGNVQLTLPDLGTGDEWPLSAVILTGALDGCLVDDVILGSFRGSCGE